MNARRIIMKGLAVVPMLLLSLCVYSQGAALEEGAGIVSLDEQQNREVLHSTLFGAGISTIHDSYLSPLWYNGTDIRVQRETMRMTNLWNGRIHNQTLIDFNADINKSPAGNVSEYAGGIRYSQGWFYNFRDGNVVNPLARSFAHWNYAAGLQASGYLGGVYMNRSGNNPGQAKADVTVDASAMVTCDMRIRKHHFLWRYQLSIPLMGVAFSPAFGQSYYEMFELKHYDHNVLFAYPGNMPSFRSRLTLDIPLKRCDVRLGWAFQSSQARFNNLRYNNTSSAFMIGFNKYFYRK